MTRRAFVHTAAASSGALLLPGCATAAPHAVPRAPVLSVSSPLPT